MRSPAPRRISTDALVIGSGAGGAVTAATLAEAGVETLIVEEGPRVDTGAMATHTTAAMQTLYRNAGLSPILGRPSIAYVEGRCVGGSTEINSAFWHRLPDDAIERWRTHYGLRDLSAEQIAALSAEIERETSPRTLAGDAAPPSSERFRMGAQRLGWAVEEVPRAQGTAPAGSAFAPGAKRSMSRTFIPRALAAGARLLPNCAATRIHTRNGRVTGVSVMVEQPDGRRPLLIEAESVFVCGGAIHTPALLRASGIRRNVGNSLRIHPMLKVAAVFDERMDSHAAALPVYQIKEFRPDVTLGGAVFTPGFLAVTLAENWDANQGAMQDWEHAALYYAACRGANRGTVRVLPFTGDAVVRYQLSPRDQHNLSSGFAHLCEALFAAGARRLYPGLRTPASITSVADCRAWLERPIPVADMSLSTVHAFSSCPMGEDTSVAATDSYGRVHGFDNLYIADASLLPDSPGVNPQGTIMAIALRNAKRYLAA